MTRSSSIAIIYPKKPPIETTINHKNYLSKFWVSQISGMDAVELRIVRYIFDPEDVFHTTILKQEYLSQDGWHSYLENQEIPPLARFSGLEMHTLDTPNKVHRSIKEILKEHFNV